MMFDFIKVACPHCSEHIEFDPECEGQTIDCPHCSGRVRLQSPQPNPRRRYRSANPPSLPKTGHIPWWATFSILAAVVVFFILGSRLNVDAAQALGGGAGSLAVLALAVLIYLIPTTIAHRRRHRNATGIFLLNLLLGWTLLGWVGALVWSVYEERR